MSNHRQFLLRERFARQLPSCRAFFAQEKLINGHRAFNDMTLASMTIHLPSRLHAALAAREREAVLRETLTPVPPRAIK